MEWGILEDGWRGFLRMGEGDSDQYLGDQREGGNG